MPSFTASIGEVSAMTQPPISEEGQDGRFATRAVVTVIAIVVIAGLLGFVLIPIAQGQSAGLSAFQAICRSLGIQPGSPAFRQPSSATVAQPVSMVAWTPEVIERLHRPNEENGSDIAANICVSCHIESGAAYDPKIPHMEGQSAFAIYKQLHDFKNGARVNELMATIVQNLDDDQMADVAAHFAVLTKGALDPRTISSGDPDIVRLVEFGNSARGLPSCASCHGVHAGGPIETPTLSGQRKDYLATQLQAFAKGERHNDIYTRMRSIAAKLRDDEIEKLAEYYSAQLLFRPQD
ncbi:MAG TPA: c-type cytochrome [Methylocella sp.]|nr:c-type cytochrome [Methylocella sp.]